MGWDGTGRDRKRQRAGEAHEKCPASERASAGSLSVGPLPREKSGLSLTAIPGVHSPRTTVRTIRWSGSGPVGPLLVSFRARAKQFLSFVPQFRYQFLSNKDQKSMLHYSTRAIFLKTDMKIGEGPEKFQQKESW